MRALEPPKKEEDSPPTSATGNRLFVGGIPIQATRKELFNYFSSFGPLKSINLSRSDTDPAVNKGFGFVIFDRHADAQAVLAHRSHHMIRCKIVASKARRPTRRRLQGGQRPPTPQKHPRPSQSVVLSAPQARYFPRLQWQLQRGPTRSPEPRKVRRPRLPDPGPHARALGGQDGALKVDFHRPSDPAFQELPFQPSVTSLQRSRERRDA